VESAVYYPKPLHRQSALARFVPRDIALPIAEAAADEVLSLPIHPELSRSDREQVGRTVRAFFEDSGGER